MGGIPVDEAVIACTSGPIINKHGSKSDGEKMGGSQSSRSRRGGGGRGGRGGRGVGGLLTERQKH